MGEMGTPTEPKPAKYFTALLSSDVSLLAAVEADLAEILGPLDGRSEVLPWSLSDYYQKEFGGGLLRRFVSFAPLASPGALASIKLKTQETENRYRVQSPQPRGRRVNVDPGYVDSGKVVLASTKNAGHRIYLESGIYAEATLFYYDGRFQPCFYTYADFLWPQTLSFLGAARDSYLAQLKRRSS
jgi:hypothetical protein